MACRKEQFVFTLPLGEVAAVPGIAADLQEHKIATRLA
jgi:NaMN:DMB phosphoribosyltransferase